MRNTAKPVLSNLGYPVIFASIATNMWTAVGLISLATAAHQGWSANIFTFASDMFPRRAIGSVVGIGGMAGAVGGLLFSLVTEMERPWTNINYTPALIVRGPVYLFAR